MEGCSEEREREKEKREREREREDWERVKEEESVRENCFFAAMPATVRER
jgi:hypothetical protein